MTTNDDIDPRDAARLRAAIERLPQEIEPASDLWGGIRARIEQGRVQELPRRPGASELDAPAPAARPMPWYASPRRLAAAAVLLVALSAGGTWWIMRPADPRLDGDPALALAQFASYEQSAAELTATLERRRAKLDPATLAVLERTLRTIDGAIAEAREALAADPANPAVQAFVVTAYRQKIDFLRRANDVAAELGS